MSAFIDLSRCDVRSSITKLPTQELLLATAYEQAGHAVTGLALAKASLAKIAIIEPQHLCYQGVTSWKPSRVNAEAFSVALAAQLYANPHARRSDISEKMPNIHTAVLDLLAPESSELSGSLWARINDTARETVERHWSAIDLLARTLLENTDLPLFGDRVSRLTGIPNPAPAAY